MSSNIPYLNDTLIVDTQKDTSIADKRFYLKIISWTFISFLSATVGATLIGPLVPETMMIPLFIICLVSLFAFSISKNPTINGIGAIIVPAILGITLYPTLNYYISTGSGNIITSAAMGTAIIFGTMAIWGWTSNTNLNHLTQKLFFILLGLIGISLINVFILKLSIVQTLISIGVIIVMSIYVFIDIQMIRDDGKHGTSKLAPSSYALLIFLDVWNIFVSLLSLLGNKN